MEYKISYRKLRIILMDRDLSPTFVCNEVGLSAGVARNIKHDGNIEVLSLAKICAYLNITFDEAVDIEITK